MAIFLKYRSTIITTAALLTLFASVGGALVGITFIQTDDEIKHNEKITLLRKLNNIIPPEKYDNDLLIDTITIEPNGLLGTDTATEVYRARLNNNDVAVVLTSIAKNGYNGPISLLVGIYADGTIAGVRVINHRETPGLGDAVSIRHSDWILDFDKKSLTNPKEKDWKVKRDGGIFDQFTGATITPRAVVKAVHKSLIYFSRNKAMLFSQQDERSNTVQDNQNIDNKQVNYDN